MTTNVIKFDEYQYFVDRYTLNAYMVIGRLEKVEGYDVKEIYLAKRDKSLFLIEYSVTVDCDGTFESVHIKRTRKKYDFIMEEVCKKDTELKHMEYIHHVNISYRNREE